jgi:hypothetical protein
MLTLNASKHSVWGTTPFWHVLLPMYFFFVIIRI